MLGNWTRAALVAFLFIRTAFTCIVVVYMQEPVIIAWQLDSVAQYSVLRALTVCTQASPLARIEPSAALRFQ